jgi:hypothetical protein
MLEIMHASSDASAAGALHPARLLDCIGWELNHWCSVRVVYNNPPFVIEVASKVRTWLAIADRIAWLSEHGEALPERT